MHNLKRKETLNTNCKIKEAKQSKIKGRMREWGARVTATQLECTAAPGTHLVGNAIGGVHDDEQGLPCEWIEISRMKAAENTVRNCVTVWSRLRNSIPKFGFPNTALQKKTKVKEQTHRDRCVFTRTC